MNPREESNSGSLSRLIHWAVIKNDLLFSIEIVKHMEKRKSIFGTLSF